MPDRLDNSAPFDDDQGTRISGDSTGAGAEAAEGIHGAPKHRESEREEEQPTSLADRDTGRRDEGGVERAGSEPFESKSHERESGYGGKGGKPKRP